MKKVVSTNPQSTKDPENIYMNDIFHILKDQKQKIDHLLRQTRQGLQQSNSRIKGFWNSGSSNIEPSTIPCKLLNDIQGYENSAGKINSILHKKVNQLKRISMKKKTYEEIEQRERDKEMFQRFTTPNVRMNIRNSVDIKQKLPLSPNKGYETTFNTRTGSVQLEQENQSSTTEGYAKRKKVALLPKQRDQQPLLSINNQSKTNGVLKRSDMTRASLEEITKIYSPSIHSYKQNQDKLHGQSMLLDTYNGYNDQQYMSMNMDYQNSSMEMMNINSVRNKQQQQQEYEMILQKDKYIDKENNQQYLLKQIQQQNLKLTQKQNQILHRQLLEQSKQYNQEIDHVNQVSTPVNQQRCSFTLYQGIIQHTNDRQVGGFLPSLNNPKIKNSNNEVENINSHQEIIPNNEIVFKQKKCGNYPCYGNIQTPDNYNHEYIQKNEIDRTGNGYNSYLKVDDDLSYQIKSFQNNIQNQQDNQIKSKRSLSVQQQHISIQNQNCINENEDKLKLIHKYKQVHLLENNNLKLPSENQIYPINILNEKKSENQNFFKRDSSDGFHKYQSIKQMPSVQQSDLKNHKRSQRQSNDLNCSQVPLNTNQSYSNRGNSFILPKRIPLPNDKLEEKIIQLQPHAQNQSKTQSLVNQNNSLSNQNSTLPNQIIPIQNQNGNHISKNEVNKREYSSQYIRNIKHQIKSTEQVANNPPFLEIYANNQRGDLKQNRQDQSELSTSQDPHNTNEFILGKQNPQYQQRNGNPPQKQSSSTDYDFIDEKNLKKKEYNNNEEYESIPFQVNFTVKKEDLRLDLSKLANSQKNQTKKMSDNLDNLNESQNSQPYKSISNQKINDDLKEKLQQNFLQRLGLSGGFLSKMQQLDQEQIKKSIKISNSPIVKKNYQYSGKQRSINQSDTEDQTNRASKVRLNDPNLFNYHKLIGCANLDEKNKQVKPYQHYHSNEKEKQEKKYYQILNEKINYQIEINLLFLEQSLLKSKSQSKKQLLEKLQAFRQEIVEASQSQESSIQNLKFQHKHLYSFNLPECLFNN